MFWRHKSERTMVGHRAFALLDAEGVRLGHVDHVMVGEGRLRVAGWTHAERVALVSPGQRVEGVQKLPRQDVAAAIGAGEDINLGFHLEKSLAGEPTLLCLEQGQRVYLYDLMQSA